MTRFRSLLAVILIYCGPVWGGYKDLKKELETYQPPVAMDITEITPKPGKAVMKDDPFEMQMRRIGEMKNAGLETMESIDGLRAFLPSAAGLGDELGDAIHDPVFAAKQVAGDFSLETVLVLAWMRSPAIGAQQDRYRASMEAFTQVAAIDEVLRQYTAFTRTLMPGVGPMKGAPPIDKRFPFPGVTALKAQVVWHQVAAAREDLEIVRRDTLVEVATLYWNLMHAVRAEKIVSETIYFFAQLESAAVARYEGGQTSFQDVIKVRINLETLKADRRTIREEQHRLKSGLRAILDLESGMVIGMPQPRNPDRNTPEISGLVDSALKHRRELKRLRALILRSEKMIELAETMILPDYAFNYALYEDETALTTGPGAMKEAFPSGRGMNRAAGLPKNPWIGQQDAYLREARKNLDARRRDLTDAENKTTAMVRTVWFNLDRAVREERLYKETVTNLSKAAVDVSTRGYESGKVIFADVIGSYTLWLKAKLALSRKTADMGVARAELFRVAGAAMEKEDAS